MLLRKLYTFTLFIVKLTFLIKFHFYHFFSIGLHFWLSYFIEYFAFNQITWSPPKVRIELYHFIHDIQNVWIGMLKLH